MYYPTLSHTQNQENQIHVGKKFGEETGVISRKPFDDRKTNAKSPVQKANEFINAKVKTSKNEDNLDLIQEYNYQEIEDEFTDICSKSQRLNIEDISMILKVYCNYSRSTTPPPVFEDNIYDDLKVPCDSLGNSLDYGGDDDDDDDDDDDGLLEVSVDNIPFPDDHF